jgi:hypothetical protein
MGGAGILTRQSLRGSHAVHVKSAVMSLGCPLHCSADTDNRPDVDKDWLPFKILRVFQGGTNSLDIMGPVENIKDCPPGRTHFRVNIFVVDPAQWPIARHGIIIVDEDEVIEVEVAS